MDVFEAIKGRRTIRVFQDKPVDQKDIEKIVEAGRWAPTGGNDQMLKFTVLKDISRLDTLAGYIIRDTGRTDYNFRNAAAMIFVSNSKNAKNVVADGACAIQNILLAAYSLGIGSGWMNQLKGKCDVPEYRAELLKFNIPADHEVIAMVAIGYPGEAPEPAERVEQVEYLD